MPYCDKPLFPDVFDTLQVGESERFFLIGLSYYF